MKGRKRACQIKGMLWLANEASKVDMSVILGVYMQHSQFSHSLPSKSKDSHLNGEQSDMTCQFVISHHFMLITNTGSHWLCWMLASLAATKIRKTATEIVAGFERQSPGAFYLFWARDQQPFNRNSERLFLPKSNYCYFLLLRNCWHCSVSVKKKKHSCWVLWWDCAMSV